MILDLLVPHRRLGKALGLVLWPPVVSWADLVDFVLEGCFVGGADENVATMSSANDIAVHCGASPITLLQIELVAVENQITKCDVEICRCRIEPFAWPHVHGDASLESPCCQADTTRQAVIPMANKHKKRRAVSLLGLKAIRWRRYSFEP